MIRGDDANDELFPVAVVGAGTMGAGIAHVAATAGHPVFLLDSNAEAVAGARSRLGSILDRQVQKQRIRLVERDSIESRITFGASTHEIAHAGLVVEAIVERLERPLPNNLDHA